MSAEWIEKLPKDDPVFEAFEFAKEAHAGVKRLSGEPYINHCLAVAESVRDWGLGDAAIEAALLHDVVEDTPHPIEEIEKKFGSEVAFLVNGLTKLHSIKYPKNANAESLRKFIVSFTEDLRVLLIKLADRHHNMKTLNFLPPEKQKENAWETAEIYAPLAYRLGMQKLSGELEDLALPYAQPEEYKWLMKEIKHDYADRQAYSQRVVPVVIEALKKHGINPLEVDSRAKRYSSLYKKLIRHEMDLGKITDLVALRVIVGTVEECYSALGVIHQMWAPLPNRFKDYIARPKPNGYRSLHTTVFALDNKILEIQIRTKEMHDEDEMGIAAHWAYQQVRNSPDRSKGWAGIKDKKELMWVEQLRNWQKSFSDQREFLESLKVDFFKERIFVLTPQNDIIDLPVGATPIDFAYQIHSDIGDQCVGAKVNGKIVPLDYELQSRDIVEIITQRNKKPSEDWLRFVKTALAKKNIKESLNAGKKNLKEKTRRSASGIQDSEFRPAGIFERGNRHFRRNEDKYYVPSKPDRRPLQILAGSNQLQSSAHEKIQKLLVKLKKLNGTKEVNYKVSR